MLLFNDILSDVSFVLVEPNVSTTIGSNILSGVRTVTPGSIAGIYVGAILLAGVPGVGGDQEAITVTAVTATTFTAAFANAHSSTDPLIGATFPSGQLTAPLFTQSEMIGYLQEVQNDFLLKVRPLYQISDVDLKVGVRFYSQPANAIRLERVAIATGSEGYGEGPYDGGGVLPYDGGTAASISDLYETTQSNLDLVEPLWAQEQGVPREWFRDQIDTAMFGLFPLPATILSAELWYSIRGNTSGNTLNTVLLVPDVFSHAMKYGVLARCFSKDGEFRDPKRADYCKKRYDLIVLLACKFMSGAGVNMEQGTRADPDFSPMPIQRAG
jgi:hypothetical protein